MATIQVRITDEDKKRAETVLKALGIDMTTAVRIFVKRIHLDQAIPFPLSVRPTLTENGFTPEFEEEVLKASDEAKRGVGLSPAFDSIDDALAYLHSSDESA